MNQHKQIEYSSFVNWILVKSKEDNVNRYNKGFLHKGKYNKNIGFFHIVDIGQPKDVICLVKPVFTIEQQKDNSIAKPIFGVGRITFAKSTEILAHYSLCNN